MAQQTIDWQKNLKVVRDGRFFKIINEDGGAPYSERFTTLQHAEKAIKAINNKRIDDEFNKATKRIKKSGDPINKRMKDYKELCQAIPSYS